jgi:hypothetical protein
MAKGKILNIPVTYHKREHTQSLLFSFQIKKINFLNALLILISLVDNLSWAFLSNKKSWNRIHNISFSLLLTNRPNKLECLSLERLSSLVLYDSLAYLANP